MPFTQQVFLAVASVLTLYFASHLSSRYTTLQPGQTFDWSKITPNEELRYHDCGARRQCARLRVPLDWNSTKRDSHVDLAIMRLAARVPVTDNRYGGAVIINPGGPGFSGIRAGATQASAAQLIFDAAYENGPEYVSASPDAKYFDIIAFDVRGVNNTTPFLTCHYSTDSRIAWALQGNDAVLGSPEVNTRYLLARSAAQGESCALSRVGREGPPIASFMNTALVARDIVEIAERHGQWRERQAVGFGKSVVDRLRWRKGEEKINFWGLSYGAVLGATVAAMQPHRVGRFLLDGPDDPENYFSGRLETNLVDADEAFGVLFEKCASAGPRLCPLWGGASSDETEGLLNSIIDQIVEHGPIAVPGDSTRGTQVITLSDVRNLLSAAVMLPQKYWFAVAGMLRPLSYRDGTAVAAMKSGSYDIFTSGARAFAHADTDNPASNTHQWAHGRLGAAIKCSDTRLTRSEQDFMSYWTATKNQSKWMGDFWATLAADCHGWTPRSQWLYADENEIASNVTANPILFASASLDPLTPLRGTKALQSRFAGSGLLEVAGAGHCSLALTSICAGRAYRRYFQTGEVRGQEVCDSVSLGSEDALGIADTNLQQALEEAMEGWL